MDVSKINWQPGDLIDLTPAAKAKHFTWHRAEVLGYSTGVVGGCVGPAGEVAPRLEHRIGVRVRRRTDHAETTFCWHELAGGWRRLSEKDRLSSAIDAFVGAAEASLRQPPIEPNQRTKNGEVLSLLRSGTTGVNSIARRCGIGTASVTARIRELRGMGWNIEKRPVKGSRQPTYHLVQP